MCFLRVHACMCLWTEQSSESLSLVIIAILIVIIGLCGGPRGWTPVFVCYNRISPLTLLLILGGWCGWCSHTTASIQIKHGGVGKWFGAWLMLLLELEGRCTVCVCVVFVCWCLCVCSGVCDCVCPGLSACAYVCVLFVCVCLCVYVSGVLCMCVCDACATVWWATVIKRTRRSGQNSWQVTKHCTKKNVDTNVRPFIRLISLF